MNNTNDKKTKYLKNIKHIYDNERESIYQNKHIDYR